MNRSAYRRGRKRGTGRGWSVRAYRQADGYPSDRVVFRDTDTGRPTMRTPVEGQSLDALFDLIERSLDLQVAVGTQRTERDLNALAERYYAWLTINDRDSDYIYNRRVLLAKHFLAEFGTTSTEKWTAELTARAIATARPKIGAHRLEDLGSTLSGLRATAYRPDHNGLRWLSPDIDPMEGVSYTRRGFRRGGPLYVPLSQRPATEAVTTAVHAAGLRGIELGCPSLPVLVAAAGFGGFRLSETLGMREDDLLPATREVFIRGVWADPHAKRCYWRDHTKNGKEREVPLSASQWTDLTALLPAARRQREARFEDPTCVPARKNTEDLTLPGVLDDAAWLRAHNAAYLFVNPATGWPWTQEDLNTEWSRIRKLTHRLAEDDPETWTAWPSGVPFRNLRHHAATWWAEELGVEWATVAYMLGDDVQTVLDHYVRTNDAARRAVTEKLSDL